MKLVQKQFLKGSREFEIKDDVVLVRMKAAFKEEKLTVLLTMLDPEPVVNKPFLEFHGRVKCGPLLSLLLDKPDTGTFDTFVSTLKQRAREEYNAFAGLKSGAQPERLAGNVYTEPPDFDDSGKDKKQKTVDVASIGTAIQMLQQHMQAEEIKALLAALDALKQNPENESNLGQLITAFDGLGPRQGAVLTYAPYVNFLLSDDPFGK